MYVIMSLCSVIYWVQPFVYVFFFFLFFFSFFFLKEEVCWIFTCLLFYFIIFLTDNEKYDGEVSLNNRADF
jgi:hypothetical protein